ncbi:hypothetical protein WI89_08125 [Burkholderia ubonensis]|uniref:DUF2827 family protein n=1 Tax=Burkholderia ubonensis TaxID=101571 RepID=UPI000756D44A|nr:DUF2827 family protein [Burkholderia ubonensis]KVD75512.1 hypothetical protein WI89_08125 [Burkholderia ubonensis]
MRTRLSVPRSPDRWRIGLSVPALEKMGRTDAPGCDPHGLFLAMTLLRLPKVDAVCWVAGRGQRLAAHARQELTDSPIQVIDWRDAVSTLNVIIEMDAPLDPTWAVEFRALGGRAVSMRMANDYVIDLERMLFQPPLLMPSTEVRYDAVWTLPAYERIGASYWHSTFRAPVRIVPPLWSPVLIEREARQRPHAPPFNYRPARQRWRVAVFEPDHSLVESTCVSLLCCEALHRENPAALDQVRVFNTQHLGGHRGFVDFIRTLDLGRHRLVSLEGRFPFAHLVAGEFDAVVCHQWESAPHARHYEALWGGYPMIHNSSWLGACGYRYTDFDSEAGGRALRRAVCEHDGALDTYRRQARKFLRRLDPLDDTNVQAYGAALAALYER